VQWVTIYRNHYVPIKIVKKPSQYDVQPVSIQVNERIVHYLCDCAPGTTSCPHIPGTTPQTGAAPRSPSESSVAVIQEAAKPAAGANLTGQATPSVRPATETTAAAPPKQWIWLSNENCYGYGYINEEGLAIVDAGTKTTTLPPTMAAAK
jgi:hypothetical protein